MKFTPTIGLEAHVRLATKTKLFCRCKNPSLNDPPNSTICPVCMGYPGTLPVPNRAAVELAVKLIVALIGDKAVAQTSKFDRKHYFYPDLPKGYQISQFDQPLGGAGTCEVGKMSVQIRRIHLEEDAGKLLHSGKTSRVDFNRAGTPLVEIVTEPCFHTTDEAVAFLKHIQETARHLGVSQARMEAGEMRVDGNVSVSNDETHGVPIEIKNMNSFKFIAAALEFEITRQATLAKAGKTSEIIKETRGWDEKTQTTVPQRTKEREADYRYFPEPDIPAFRVADIVRTAPATSVAATPAAQRAELIGLGLNEQVARQIVARGWTLYIVALASKKLDTAKAATFLLNNIAELPTNNATLTELLAALEEKTITDRDARAALPTVLEGQSYTAHVATRLTINDTQLRAAIKRVIRDNPQAITDIKRGKTEALGFLVGQLLKAAKGDVHPNAMRAMLESELNAKR